MILRAFAIATLIGLAAARPCHAGPFIWDQDGDHVDDRMETVQLLGYAFSFENADTLARQRFEVSRVPGGLAFGVYVVYLEPPTASDLASLTLLGMPVLHRIEAVPALRSVATFAQAEAAAALPGVERVEVVPLLYPGGLDGAATVGVRDPSGAMFPGWDDVRSERGEGQVIAFLDTGINDAFDPVTGDPGHESLRDRCLGGARFLHGDSTLDTPRDGSVNPVDRGGLATRAHGTHVASLAIGAGGPENFFTGVAPAARFVDVKVLDDTGIGRGVPEALDWVIANRARDWGDPDPAWTGIDVVNLSLSSLDPSDGNDLGSRLAQRATELGLTVVASMGNEGAVGQAPSPASGDGVLAVGAWDAQRSPGPEDDGWPAFGTVGPRASDGDTDALDELKPALLAPGVAVLGADGALDGDGEGWQRLTGTSMSAAFVSGAAALLRSAFPDLDPPALAALLTATARRNLPGLPAAAPGADPRWHAARGYGLLDVHAALLEWIQPAISQMRRLHVAADGDDDVLTLWTQRERGAQHFVFERAPDAGGAPGVFAAFDSVAAAGDSSLADPDNLEAYVRTAPVPPAERGLPAWWRVAWTEGGVRHHGPARLAARAAGPSRATVEVTIVHDAYDADVEAWLEPATPSGPSAPGSPPGARAAGTIPRVDLPAGSAAVATEWVDGTSAIGRIARTFRVEIPEGMADAWLPPDAAHPWALRVSEGGYLNRSGRVTDFHLTWHASGGDVAYVGAPLPSATVEGQTTSLYAPQQNLDAGPIVAGALRLRALPNPVVAGARVRFDLPAGVPTELTIHDLAGREVARVPVTGASRPLEWSARDASGRPLPGGVYFARIGGVPAARLVVLGS